MKEKLLAKVSNVNAEEIILKVMLITTNFILSVFIDYFPILLLGEVSGAFYSNWYLSEDYSRKLGVSLLIDIAEILLKFTFILLGFDIPLWYYVGTFILKWLFKELIM